MIREDAKVLLEQAGNLVRKVEIVDPSTGCRFKVKTRQGRVIIRLLHSDSTQWSISARAVLPGHPMSKSTKPTVILLPKLANGIFEVGAPFVTTYSFALAVSLRTKNIIGDLFEGHTQVQLSYGNKRAIRWLVMQVIGSIAPVSWQIVRYDVIACLRDWLLWYLPWYLPLWGKVQLEARSATTSFTAKAAENIL
jgi:hypothetical protein